MEHLRDSRKQDIESHMHLHRDDKHPDSSISDREMFKFKILSKHKSSLSRQITEAVEIMTYNDGCLLNRKEQFNRCTIPEIFFKGANNKIIIKIYIYKR